MNVVLAPLFLLERLEAQVRQLVLLFAEMQLHRFFLDLALPPYHPNKLSHMSIELVQNAVLARLMS
jgi:hypothetical protein